MIDRLPSTPVESVMNYADALSAAKAGRRVARVSSPLDLLEIGLIDPLIAQVYPFGPCASQVRYREVTENEQDATDWVVLP